MMLFVHVKSLSVIKFCWGAVDPGANDVLISIRETAKYGKWEADRI